MNNMQDLHQRFNSSADFWDNGPARMTDGKVAMCKIYATNASTRTYSIKTYGSDPVVGEGDYTNVQLLSPYSSPLGDEASFLVEPGAQGMCVFHGGLPWIFGFFNPVTLDDDDEVSDLEKDGAEPAGASAAQNKEQVNTGDFVYRTAGKCRLVLRRGGEIEIESTKLCRRTFFPAQNLINEICQNFEFRTDGGTIDWTHNDIGSEKTKCIQEWRDDIRRTNVVIDEKGSVEADSTLIHRFAIGPGAPIGATGTNAFKPVFVRETQNTGQTEFKINEIAYHELIGPDGEYTLGINDYSYFKNIKPSGQVTINICENFQSTILPTGELKLDIGIGKTKKSKQKPVGGVGKFSLNIKPTGETTLNINNKVNLSIKDSGQLVLDIGAGTSVFTILPSGAVTLKTTKSITAEVPEVNLKASFIKLGKSVSDVVPMGRLVLKMINRFIQTYNSHSHSHAGLAGITSPPAQTTMSIGEDVLSTTVEVQP